MTKLIHKNVLIILSYLMCFFFPKRAEIDLIEPFNLELFSVMVLLGISAKPKKAVEYLISLKRSFYSSLGQKQVLGKLGFLFFKPSL